MLLRTLTAEHSVRSGAQIDIDRINVAHHIPVRAEGRHHLLLRGVDLFLAGHDGRNEVAIAERLQGIDQRWCIAGTEPVGPVALQAVGAVPQISDIGVPVDGAIIGDLEGRVAVLVEIFPVPGADGFGVARSIGVSSACRKKKESKPRPRRFAKWMS